MIKIGSDICSNYLEATTREWLETNGIGGYASGTISGTNTRRYHGLLVAASEPPLGRIVTVAKIEETLIVDGERYELSSNRYPGALYPEGYKFLTRFRLDPFPIWTYTIGAIEIERSIFMVHGENTTVIQWSLINGAETAYATCHMEIKPLIAFRDHHHLRVTHSDLRPDLELADGRVSMRPHEAMPRLYFAHNAERSVEQGHWYRDLEYAIERERGFDYHEDLYQPFSLTFDRPDQAVVVLTTEVERNASETGDLEATEIKRRAELIAHSGCRDKDMWPLILAADQFIVDRGAGKTVIAGYPWFSDWGRDTMIALNGLTLSTNRLEIAKTILLEFSKHISEGMLPNRFPDSGMTAEYNSVDATLWFFEAVRAYVGKTGDLELVREKLYDKLADIIKWHVSGTRYNIHVDTDGLLYAGESGVQLTWMDAKIGDWVVTPRTGKPVEIQALWYNALRIMSDLSESLGNNEAAATYQNMAQTAKGSFNGQFWNVKERCLFDVVDGNRKDGSVRPNQIFAVSLSHTMLAAEKCRQVVDKVRTELLTPFGLRSLSPNDPNYVPVYVGSPSERDAAYHQGTVWGWLIGPFIDAYQRVHPDSPETEEQVEAMLASFRSHSSEALVGQISEIFDAEPPFFPRGCGAQAWSVGELLRVLRIESK